MTHDNGRSTYHTPAWLTQIPTQETLTEHSRRDSRQPVSFFVVSVRNARMERYKDDENRN